MTSSSILLSGTGDKLGSFPAINDNYTSWSSSSTSSRNSSFGSLSFSSYPEYSPSPIHSISTLQNSGVPFSWEKHPGIPKKSSSNLSDSSKDDEHSSALILLPLPPASCSNHSKRFTFQGLFTIRKKTHTEIIRKDPFVAALMKCSKEDEEEFIIKQSKSAASSSSSGHGFGFGFNVISCKNSCSVVESSVLIPKHRRKASYDQLNRRS